jgi:hypothetical protein
VRASRLCVQPARQSARVEPQEFARLTGIAERVPVGCVGREPLSSRDSFLA